jgi:nucleoside-diphosphate-sugar epimerase
LPVGAVRNARSFLYVGNCIVALAALLGADPPPSGPYFVSDADDLSTPELVQAVAIALARPARLFSMPMPVLRLTAILADGLRPILPLPFGSELLDRLTESLAVSNRRISTEAAYVPAYTVREGMAATAEWFASARASQ